MHGKGFPMDQFREQLKVLIIQVYFIMHTSKKCIYQLNAVYDYTYSTIAAAGVLSFKSTSFTCWYVNIPVSEISDMKDRYNA
jgi:hypothetical protein